MPVGPGEYDFAALRQWQGPRLYVYTAEGWSWWAYKADDHIGWVDGRRFWLVDQALDGPEMYLHIGYVAGGRPHSTVQLLLETDLVLEARERLLERLDIHVVYP